MTNDSPARLERIEQPLPDGFDAAQHLDQLTAFINKRHAGGGFELQSIDPFKNVAYFVRGVGAAVVTSRNDERFEMNLPRTTKASDGQKIAAQFEGQYPGFYVTEFDPFLFKIELTKMKPEAVRARGALASALGCKPWEIVVTPRVDGGFDLDMSRINYVPSKHEAKLEEVTTHVIGRFGWYIQIDSQNSRASIIPSQPPTFPAVVPMDLSKLGNGSLDKTPFALKLPAPGKQASEVAFVDWTMSPYVILGGLPRSGKHLTHDTKVATPDGWKRHGDLHAGDRVFARDGSITTVTSESAETVTDTYELHLSDGQVLVAGGEHLMTVSTRRSRLTRLSPKERARRARVDAGRAAKYARYEHIARECARGNLGARIDEIAVMLEADYNAVRRVAKAAGIPYEIAPGKGSPRIYVASEVVMAWLAHVREFDEFEAAKRQPLETTLTVAEMAKRVRVEGGRANYAIALAAPIATPSVDLPLDPYVLGAWLGDGSTAGGQITAHADDQPHLKAQLERAGYEFKNVCRNDPRDKTIAVTGLTTKLREAGVLGDKHIPTAYLRASIKQRLALLAGLMDTDGTIDMNGNCELSLSHERLANDALELIRSLGIRASVTVGAAGYRGADGEWVECKDRHRIHFTTDQRVFRLPRKAERLPEFVADPWLYVIDIVKVESQPAKCIMVDHPEHLYLVGEFVPTHNSVSINDIIADCRSNGSELVIITTADKSVDFAWARAYVRDGGWGCQSHRHAITALALAYEELKRRANLLHERGVQNWYQIPEHERFAPITIIVDEVSMMLMTDRLPAGVDKKLPEVQEIIERNRLKFKLQKLIYDTMAEMGFVGARVLLSTQVTNATTGLPPTMKALVGNKFLQGTNPSKTQREQAFNQAANVPQVPENLRAGGGAAKGVGTAELEGQDPFVYKPFYADTSEVIARFEELGLKPTSRPDPSEAEIERLCPSVDEMDDDDLDDAGPSTRERTPSGKPLDPRFGPVESFDDDGKRLFGAAAAASASKQLASAPTCPSCDKPIQPNGDCGCSQ